MGREGALPPDDRAIADLADRQDGVVGRDQLLGMGLSGPAVDKRVRRGRLFVVQRGVYAVGRRQLNIRGQWRAAVLALGDGAVLSHRAAAAVWDLRHVPTGDIDVTVPSQSGRKSRPGITVHRSTTLSSADAIRRDGLPVTTVARTLLDLAEVVHTRELERALDRAEQLQLFDLKAIDEQIRRGNGRAGAATLSRCLSLHTAGSTLTESELEERFLPLVDQAGLPPPAINDWLVLANGAAIRPDYMWKDRRLIVELDGFGPHSTRKAMRTDRRRDRRLQLEDWKVLRYTYEDITLTPGNVVAELRSYTS